MRLRLEQKVKVNFKDERFGSTEVLFNVKPKVEGIGYNGG